LNLTAATSPPWVIAHRGFSANYPENTFSAFDAALETPIHAIETDIQMSRDKTALIYHNHTLLNVGGGFRRVRTQSAARLAELNAAHGSNQAQSEPLPLLDQLLARYGQKCILLLEIKRREPNRDRFRALMDLVIQQVRHHNLEDRVCILCYNLELLAYGYQQAPNLRYVLNQDTSHFHPDAHFLFAYSMNIKGLKPHFSEQVRQSGKPLFTFTCNTEDHLKQALKCGVNGIMSDNPRWLAQVLQTQFT